MDGTIKRLRKPSLRLWVFFFFGGMALVISLVGWLLFTQVAAMNQQAIPGWVLPVYLLAALLVAGPSALGFNRLIGGADDRFIHALQHLAHTELPSLSSALSKLAEGDLTVQVSSNIRPLDAALYPEAQAQVTVFNEIAEEIQQIYRELNNVTGEPCRRLVYVGANSFREGRTCCELMGQVLQGQGKVAILTSLHTHAMEIRKAGFLSLLNEKFSGMQMVAYVDCLGQLDSVYPKVMDLLQSVPDLAGIYVTNGSTPDLVARALVDAGKAGDVKLVCHDMLEGTMQALRQGIVTTTISQDPFAQGHDPVIYLYNYLVSGQVPPQPKMTTHMDRITLENYRQFWDPQRGAIENDATLDRRARPVEALPERPLRILVLGREDIPFFEPVKRGALSAAEELKSRNTLVEWLEPQSVHKSRQYGASDYGPAIEAAIAKKYDAITVPVYDKALVPYINRAVAAGIPVATYNSEPNSLRNLTNNLISQAEQLREISVSLAKYASTSEEHASRINTSIGAMSQALYQEAQSAVNAIQNTEEMASAITSISAGAREQASAVETVSDAIDRISIAVSSTNNTALTGEETAAQAVRIAMNGGVIIKQTLDQLQTISNAVSASVQQIYELNKISKQIDTVVNLVSDFAEQTNLLAMNAAIEAAHAGEYGAGFAVVGSEIRKLARQSEKSTKEIAGLISQVQRNSSKMVNTVDEAMQQAQSGSKMVSSAGQAIDELLRSSETMKMQIEKVVQANLSAVETLDQLIEANNRVSNVVLYNVTATEQVSNNIQRTVGIINNITGISQENSSSIQGIHTSMDEVSERAQQLKETTLALVSMAEELQGSAASFKIHDAQQSSAD